MEKSFTVRDVVMDAVLVALVAVQAFIIFDELSDGKLSREMSVKIVYARSKLKQYIEREDRIRRHTGAVIFDAITTVEDADRNDGED